MGITGSEESWGKMEEKKTKKLPERGGRASPTEP